MNAGACVNCAVGKYSGQTGATSSVVCTDCGAGTYSTTLAATAVDTCLTCPTNSNSPSSSSAVAACTCIVGYTGANGGACSACVTGKYKSTTGSAVCTDCPTNSNSPSPSSASTDCTCNAGYTGVDGGPCSACVAGKSKTSSGGAACTDCGAGTFSATAGASVCTVCAVGGVSAAGSTACVFDCPTGSTGLPGACLLCVAGKYKTSAGSAACTDCGPGTYSVTVGASTSSICLTCPVNSNAPVSSSVGAACTCNAGYTGPDGGVCSACLPGSLKVQTGSAACALCPNNTFSAETGRSSACEPCQANAVSAAGSAGQEYCYCNPGYAHAAGMTTCRICDRGTWNSQLGRTACSNCSVGMYSVNFGAIGSETCLTCPLGQWSFEGSPNCNLCPANSRAGAGSGSQTECKCDDGYTGADGSTCVSCGPGTYKDASGSAACSACPARMTSAAAAVRLSDCWCVTGHTMVSGLCEPIVPRAVSATGALAGVPANASAASVANATQALRASVALQFNTSIDLVQIERVPDSNQVRVSIFGRSDTDLDRIEAQLRLVGITGLDNAQTTVLHGQMVAGQFVECPANYRVYERDQNLARSCGASGTDFCQAESMTQYDASSGPQNANDGVMSSLGDAVKSEFMSGCWGERAEGEKLCGLAYEWWQVDLSRQRDIRSVTLHVRKSDYFNENFDIELSIDNITFVKCATKQDASLQYSWIEPYQFISTHKCVGTARYVRLSANTMHGRWIKISEVQVYGETLPGTCKCAPGHMLQADLSSCAACAGGKYSNETDSRACTDCPADTYSNDARTACSGCPANSVSVPGTSTVLACTCIAGYFFFLAPEGRSCLPCAAGSYKNEAGNVNCSVCSLSKVENQVCCPADSTFMSSACFCNAGFSGAANGPCAACGVGKYKNTTSTEPCGACDAGSFTAANASTGCALCAANTFSGAGASSCTACPNLTQSASGSNASAACECVAGYTGSGGLQPCTPCAAGTYKTDAGSGSCTACPARTFSGALGATSIAVCTACHPNATSAAGSPSEEYCYCEAGFAQVNHTDRCALCTQGKYNAQLARTACSNCSVGLYAAGVGSKGLESCLLCPAGQWSPEGSPDCKMCPVNSVGPQRSGLITNCICDAGFTGPNGGPCVACEAGKYKTANGSAACTSCTANANSFVGSINVSDCSCNAGYTGPNVGPCVACAAGTAKSVSGSAACSTCPADTFSNSSASVCTACPAGFKALPGTTTSLDCCGLNSSPGSTICPTTDEDPLTSILATSPVYLMTSAEAWDAANSRFTDLSGNGRHGVLTAGTVTVGSVTGNGAGLSIPYVEGTTGTSIFWGAGSIPSTFTVCSITRYSGTTKQRILQCNNLNWLHGHFNNKAGATHYNGQGATEKYSISPNTNWVVVCSRNIWGGAAGVIANGAVTCTGCGGVGNCNLCININGQASEWQLSKLYVWDRHLTDAEFAEASVKLNSYVAGERIANSCVPSKRCSCNAGYTGPDTGASKGQCTICSSGTYKATNGTAACTSCPVNANSSAGSVSVTACSCNPGYTGPDVGPCVACAAGTFKNMSGSSSCSVCPANTYSAGGASSCTSCPAGFQSAPGSLEVADCCNPNTTYVTNLYYALSSATRGAVDQQMYNVRVSSVPMLGNRGPGGSAPVFLLSDGYNEQGFLRFSKTSPTSGHNYMDANEDYWGTGNGLTIVAVIRFREGKRGAIWSMQMQNEQIGFELYMSSAVQFCVNGYSSNMCTDQAVPVNVWLQVTYTYNPSVTNKQLLQVVYTSTGNTVVLSKTDTRSIIGGFAGRKYALGYTADTTYSNYFNDIQIKGNPDGDRPNFDLAGFYFMQTLASDADIVLLLQAISTGSNIAYDKSTSCPCNAGFSGTGRSNCWSCVGGTYKNEVKSASCSMCPMNTYSTAVQATSLGTCIACPSDSVSVAGSTRCVCNFGYAGDMANCVACATGKYKRVLGSSACIDCPANTQAVGAATTVCSSLPSFSGLGYALEDVARSCGVTLDQTCKTLSNGATTNAVGVVDGALDANANTFVSVAFNPNLARSCGITGTAACAASNAPAFQGAASLGNDGDINTATRTQYGTANLPFITPFWGVDFGRSRSVFAVKILMMIAYGNDGWAFLKDFKITVGDSPVWSQNAVCADYLTGAGQSYVTFACEDTVRGRYLHVVGGPHVDNYVTISEIAVDAFNYTATPALMQPWWAVDFEAERAVAAVSIQTQAAGTVQVRVGHSTDPLQNAVCASGTIVPGVNNTLTCATAMAGRYVSVLGTANSVLVLNEVRVVGAAAAQCAAGTYKALVGNTNCTVCPAFSSSVVGATSFSQCICSAPYF